MKKTAVIFDLDATLCEVSPARQKLQEAKDWDAFHKLGAAEPCIKKCRGMLHRLSVDNEIIIITARPEKHREATTIWLQENGIPFCLLLMRGDIDDSPSHKIKADHLVELLLDYYIVLAVDDREDILAMYMSYGVPCQKPPQVLDSPPERLKKAAELFEERDKIYGSSYKSFGAFVHSLFPEGIRLDTERQMQRWGLFQMMLTKVHRYAHSFDSGGHPDSLADLSVYSAMLAEIDEEG